MDSNDKIWILMSRSLNGEISAEEQLELKALLLDDPDLNLQYSMLTKFWKKSFDSDNILKEENNEKALFKKIISKAEIERQNANEDIADTSLSFIRKLLSKRLIYAYAASIVLVLTFFLSKNHKINQRPEQLIVAQNGSRSKVLLPDGTTVWLNGGSKLYYDYEFSGPLREVRLDGEAFFDVVKLKDRPFIVHAGKIDIKVHGTAFNVKCYHGDKNIEATLLHGKIEVIDNTDKKKPPVFLVPNQKLIIPVTKPEITVKAEPAKIYEVVNLDKNLQERERIETAWIYNRMEFRGERFDDLAKKLERWYNVRTQFEDNDVKSLMFNGSFEEETVEQAFSALQKVGKFNYRIQGREIFIESPE